MKSNMSVTPTMFRTIFHRIRIVYFKQMQLLARTQI